jgi:isoleucyl-tRNA synthetase
MQGFRQRFQNGFDAQGLWVEVEVEKELGFKNKKEIEAFGVAKFVELCCGRVKKFSGIQTEQSKRLGYFMDWDHSYYTLSEDNNYMIWRFLKKCAENGWIYKGNDSVPWCPRCETAISQHEMLTEDYKELTHESIYLAFPIVGQKDEYLLVWTTTPWTIPANIAIAVNTDLEYSLMEIGKKKYWIAKEAVSRVLGKVKAKELKSVRGSKLVGLRYEGAFDDLPKVREVAHGKNDKFHVVVATDDLILPVTTTEGTGLVHTAVSAGVEDFKLGQKIGLPMIPVINDDASYMSGLGEFSGQNAKKNPRIILDYFEKLDGVGKHFYFKIENYTHRYPACWRCKTELVWKVTDEWYIAMDTPSKLKPQPREISFEDDEEIKKPQDTRTLRERMKSVAQRINWIPSFGKERELDWLNNMHDWLISKKNRYWGLALPIWECKKCGNFDVLGSKEELNERSVAGNLKGSPHKPQIDLIKIKCSRCGAQVSRIEPVGNPWLDAGIVAFSTISQNNMACNFDPTKTKPLYADDRASWQNWFPADFITESFPGQFKNWFYALIAMSTVMEDAPPMKTVLGFGTMVDEKGQAFHKSKGNAIEFVEGADTAGADVIRWFCARTDPSQNVLFGYKSADEIRRRFHLKIWNIYNFFVTYALLDGWAPNPKARVPKPENVLDKWIIARLNQTIKVVTECLEKYDAFPAASEIEKFVDDFSLWYIRRSRDRVGPAAESEKDKIAFYRTTYFVLHNLSRLMAPFMPFLSEAIYQNLTKSDSVHLSDFPTALDLRSAETKMITEMEIARKVAEMAHAVRKEKAIPVRQPLLQLTASNYQFSKEVALQIARELNVKYVVSKGGKGEIKIKLDTKISPELAREAEVRDLVRKIQEERKRLGLNLNQEVNVWTENIPDDKKLLSWMTQKAQINKLSQGKFRVVKH